MSKTISEKLYQTLCEIVEQNHHELFPHGEGSSTTLLGETQENEVRLTDVKTGAQFSLSLRAQNF